MSNSLTKDKLKRTVRIIAAVLLCMACLVLPADSSAVKAESSDGFEILTHDVDMEVSADGSILVTETLDVHFTTQRHGIYVNIPTTYDMTWIENGQSIYRQYTFPVHKVKMLSSQSHETTYYTNGVQIKIGSGNYYANIYETYRFSYIITTRDLDLNGMQMLFMNIVSDQWKADTGRTTFRIAMPDTFDINEVWFDTPQGQTQTTANDFVCSISGNTISGSYNTTLRQGEAITVKILLPASYFTFPDVNSYAMAGMLAGGIFALIWATLFFIFGNDTPLLRHEEYHAPAGISPAEFGYFLDGKADASDICSLIIDWGRRGLVTIKQENGQLTVTKQNELEPGVHKYEEILWNGLFKKKDTVVIDKLKNKFYRTMDSAIAALEDEHKDPAKRLVTKTSVVLQIIGSVLLPMPLAVFTLTVGYGYSFDPVSIVIAVFQIILLWIAILLINVAYNKRYLSSAKGVWLPMTVSILLASGSFALTIYVVGHYQANLIYGLAALAFEAVAILSIVFMTKRTAYADEMLNHVLGLRQFIIHADTARLAGLNSENPYYFYDILPYAYALGLVKVWNDHFVNLSIKPCEWYSDGYNYNVPYMTMVNFDDHFRSMEQTMTSVPAPKGGSGGSGISGGSSSGGFSGGGFGGSGGGSW